MAVVYFHTKKQYLYFESKKELYIRSITECGMIWQYLYKIPTTLDRLLHICCTVSSHDMYWLNIVPRTSTRFHYIYTLCSKLKKSRNENGSYFDLNNTALDLLQFSCKEFEPVQAFNLSKNIFALLIILSVSAPEKNILVSSL